MHIKPSFTKLPSLKNLQKMRQKNVITISSLNPNFLTNNLYIYNYHRWPAVHSRRVHCSLYSKLCMQAYDTFIGTQVKEVLQVKSGNKEKIGQMTMINTNSTCTLYLSLQQNSGTWSSCDLQEECQRHLAINHLIKYMIV